MDLSRSETQKISIKPPPFPLLKLPLLTRDEILKEMDILAQVQLYTLSNKTKGIVQSFIKRNSSKDLYNLELLFESDEDDSIELQFGSNDRIEFKFVRDLECIDSPSSYLKLEDIVVPVNVDYKTYTITTYWNNKKSGFKDLFLCFCKIFNPVLSLDFKYLGSNTLAYEILDYITIQKLKLYEARSYLFPDVRICQSLLKLSIRKLFFFYLPEECVQKTWEEPLKIDELYIAVVDQINIWDFLQIRTVVIMSKIWKDQEFNTFLKRWITSEFRVEHLKLEMKNPNLESIFEGLSTTPVRKACVDGIFKEFEDGKCFGIQKINGEKAIVYITNNSINLEITSY